MQSQLVLMSMWAGHWARSVWTVAKQPVDAPHAGRLTALAGALAAAGLMLAACGGGGGSTTGAAPAPAATGTVNLAVTDGPMLDATNVWVTIKQVDFHTSSNANGADSNWQKFPLTAPVTIDLNQLSNGALNQVFTGLSLPVGSYQQIRLYLASADDALSASASAAGLTYNDQVTYTPTTGPNAGVVTKAPLEIAAPTQGIGLVGTFNVVANQTLSLAVEFDVGHDVVRYKHGSLDAFTMKPVLRYYDLSQSGAITGRIDTTACKTLPLACSGFVVKAERPSADGTYNTVARWTQVKADGSFTLFPLPASAGQTYDIMVRGRNAQTMIVKAVPVTVGGTPASGATAVSNAALAAQTSAEFNVAVSPALSPTGGAVQFYQTPSATDKPYEIRFRSLNPFTGDFTTLAGNTFPLTSAAPLVGSYVAGGSPSLVASGPQEGAGSYTPVASAGGYARTSGTVVNALQTTSTFAAPSAAAGVAQLGSVSGAIVGGTGNWTNGQIVVARFGTVVNTVDISSAINGGNYTVGKLPSGSVAQPLGGSFLGGGAYYYAYARLWNSANTQGPNGTPRIRTVAIDGVADLRTSASATLNVTLP